MFSEDIPAFLSDFGESVVYTDSSSSKQFTAIIDHNVELIGYEGEVAATVTTLTFESDSDITIGGTITTNTESYIVDAIISDDKVIKTVSVVKQ